MDNTLEHPEVIDNEELIIENKQDIVHEEKPQWLEEASDITGQEITAETFQINVDNSGVILGSAIEPLTSDEIAAQNAIDVANAAIQESLRASENVAIFQEIEASDAVIAQQAKTAEELEAARLKVQQDAQLVAEAQVEAARAAKEADIKFRNALDAIARAELQEQDLEESVVLDNVLTGVDDVSYNAAPRLVFIIPYRDRVQQQIFFNQHMKNIMEDVPSNQYKIFYVNQCDNRDFNRGAMKNIGFLAVKELYPNDYKNITLVFNDVDTMPYTKNFLNYNTTKGVVKHFYGVKFALGGIVSINASDFELCGGFPNFWSWGYEDNMLNKRVLAAGIHIDRSQFYPLMDKNIFQMKDGLTRIVNRTEFTRYTSQTNEGWHSIRSLKYNVDENSGFINVTSFMTEVNNNPTENTVHDLRNGAIPFKGMMSMSGRKKAPLMRLQL